MNMLRDFKLVLSQGVSKLNNSNEKNNTSTLDNKVHQDISKNALLLLKKKQISLRRTLQQKQNADFYYYIDIVGTCNLRCPSCPVGNYPKAPVKGLMPLEKYQAILEKISNEHSGEKVFIDLYNWGEPGLHKQLGEIICMTKEMGHGVGISTNLNVFPDMANVIKQSPTYIRISLSGYFNDVYQETHKLGDINLVKANMHLLRQKIDQYESDTIVQVGYHIYRDNFDVDFWKMQALCEDLEFIFAPTLASLMPVEKAVKAVDGEVLEQDKALLQKLVVSTEKRVELLAELRPKYRDCQYRQIRTTINFDGSVPLCCATFEEDQIIAKDFLTVSRKELKAKKYAHSFCKTCQVRSLDLVYTNMEPHHVDNYAVSVLGERYKAFLDEWNVSLEPIVEWEDKELSAQEAYDLAMQYESNNLNQAIQLYQRLIVAFPRHGEALYRLGVIFENGNDFVQSLKYFESALMVSPSYQRYIDAVHKLRTA